MIIQAKAMKHNMNSKRNALVRGLSLFRIINPGLNDLKQNIQAVRNEIADLASNNLDKKAQVDMVYTTGTNPDKATRNWELLKSDPYEEFLAVIEKSGIKLAENFKTIGIPYVHRLDHANRLFENGVRPIPGMFNRKSKKKVDIYEEDFQHQIPERGSAEEENSERLIENDPPSPKALNKQSAKELNYEIRTSSLENYESLGQDFIADLGASIEVRPGPDQSYIARMQMPKGSLPVIVMSQNPETVEIAKEIERKLSVGNFAVTQVRPVQVPALDQCLSNSDLFFKKRLSVRNTPLVEVHG
jgi:hypothetical protein